jgi:hypothetical protein
MKPQIYSAYVEGLCPLLLMEIAKSEPNSNRQSLSAAACDQACADLSRMPSRRKRALLLILILGLAIGAWQHLSRPDARQAAEVSVRDSATHRTVLRG